MSTAVQGDPRRPREVHSFVREEIDSPRDLADYYSTLSLVCGIAAFSLKWKIAAWISFILCGAAFANSKNGDSEMRQLSWAIMTATSAIVSCYSGGYRVMSAAPAAGPTPSPTEPLN